MSICKLPLIVLLLALFGSAALAADTDPERAVKDQARAACDALVSGDLDKFVGWTHPKLVQAMGGRERLVELLKTGQKEMAKQGIQLLSASIQSRVELAQGGDDRFAIVPYDLEMSVPAGRALVRTWLLGVSPDQGKTWTFIDGGKLNAAAIKEYFPNFPGKLALPAKQQPQFERKKS
jgi:hypothetical protein